MEHVYWVVENALAGRPGPHNIPWDPLQLRAHGIGGVISLDGPVHVPSLRQAGLAHLAAYQPMVFLDSEQLRSRFASEIPPIIDFIDEVRQGGEAVLVHCYHGRDRTGAVLACYLVARAGLRAAEAVRKVRDAHPLAMIADGYEEAVATFAAQWAERDWVSITAPPTAESQSQ